MYRVTLAPVVAEAVRKMHPSLRKEVREGLRLLSDNPYAGKRLQESLSSFFTYRIRRYRVIYGVDDKLKVVKVYMVGHRRDIYELFGELLQKIKDGNGV